MSEGNSKRFSRGLGLSIVYGLVVGVCSLGGWVAGSLKAQEEERPVVIRPLEDINRDGVSELLYKTKSGLQKTFYSKKTGKRTCEYVPLEVLEQEELDASTRENEERRQKIREKYDTYRRSGPGSE